jgi:hypothetical protein
VLTTPQDSASAFFVLSACEQVTLSARHIVSIFIHLHYLGPM